MTQEASNLPLDDLLAILERPLINTTVMMTADERGHVHLNYLSPLNARHMKQAARLIRELTKKEPTA